MSDDLTRGWVDNAGSGDAASTEPAELTDADLAAEPDDDSDALGEDPDDDDEGDFAGVCRGGPYDGRTVYCRAPQGFLLVHRDRKLVWIYDAAGGTFVARGEPLLLDDEKRWQTVEQGAFDVIAYDDGPVPA